MNKIWCRHIRKHAYQAVWPTAVTWRFLYSEHGLQQSLEVPRSWKVCPVCEAERPTRENIAAAELRFAMDND